MPLHYNEGILKEHILTRRHCGIFDVSHMGRIFFRGPGSIPFLQHVLTNNVQALDVGESQYTLIPNKSGGALDDAYLYRFKSEEFLLVVNASNRKKDLIHLGKEKKYFSDVEILDKTDDIAMISLQGPMAEEIFKHALGKVRLPDRKRNSLSSDTFKGCELLLARTGYTGEPVCFELFIDNSCACKLWRLLVDNGAAPVGLGARDTLRLEAGLPLYGHELGSDREGNDIPIFALKLAELAVSFSKLKGAFVGRDALYRQHAAIQKNKSTDFSTYHATNLPERIRALTLTGKGIAREGYNVFFRKKCVGYVTSGTSVPYVSPPIATEKKELQEKIKLRSIALALLDATIQPGDMMEIEVRKKMCEAVVVKAHISGNSPPYVKVLL